MAQTVVKKRLLRLLRTFYICILNFKGGIGKTTCSTHLAYYFAHYLGLRVLLIDCDMQGNSSRALTKDRPSPTLTNVLKGEVPIHHAIRQVRENLFLIPSDQDLDKAAKHIISQGMGGYSLLSRSLKALEKGQVLKGFENVVAPPHVLPLEECQFDIVIMDNAGFTPVTESSLYTCDGILPPVEMEYFSYEGIFLMMEKLESVMEDMGRELEILGVVPYNIDERFKMTGTYSMSLKKAYEVEITVPIRTDATIKYAQPAAKTVFELDPKCNAAQDFIKLGDQIYQRIVETLQDEKRN